tara:strand:- start:106 stop:606 length:501 start_codon:yes stop_codon:yes gene_type:complete
MSKENKENGRVRIDGKKIINNFDLYDKIPIHHCSRYQDALVGNWQETPLSNAFFSKENMVILQNGIRAGVYAKSENKYVIGLQDCDTLRIVMRSIFLQYSANMSTQLTEQLEGLNKMVLDYCIPQVYGELEGYIKYREDVSSLPTPLSLPTSSSYKTNTLELKQWF